jgi:hypothetical protein
MMMSASIDGFFPEAARLANSRGTTLLLVNCVANSRRYHADVARLFILFLIALLPLRGWTAERMVFAMDTSPVAVWSQGGDVTMSEDCALHMGMDTGTAHHESAAGHGANHKGCESCQLCMPLVALDAAVVLAVATLPEAAPAPHIGNFVSADPARDVKPPIS